MSRASKVFLGTSLVFMTGTIWGVHWLQQRESDNMYLGVIRDDERVRAKELAKANAAAAVNAVQPAAVLDDECQTCIVSPPPQLLEAQSREARAAERAARLAEYEQQKGLAARLEKSQPATGGRGSSERLV